MNKRVIVIFGVIALSVSMFGIGYWVAVKRMDRSMNLSMGYLSYSLYHGVISDAGMDGDLLELAMKGDSKKVMELLQRKYYGEVLMVDEILRDGDHLTALLEDEPILARRYAGEIKISAERVHVEAVERLKRYPYQLVDEQGNDRLKSFR